jgi:hypothetical protein
MKEQRNNNKYALSYPPPWRAQVVRLDVCPIGAVDPKDANPNKETKQATQ